MWEAPFRGPRSVIDELEQDLGTLRRQLKEANLKLLENEKEIAYLNGRAWELWKKLEGNEPR